MGFVFLHELWDTLSSHTLSIWSLGSLTFAKPQTLFHTRPLNRMWLVKALCLCLALEKEQIRPISFLYKIQIKDITYKRFYKLSYLCHLIAIFPHNASQKYWMWFDGNMTQTCHNKRVKNKGIREHISFLRSQLVNVSMCFILTGDSYCFKWDHVLQWSTVNIIFGFQ